MTRQKTALVTGASSGIGYEVSKELASRGFKVYAIARRLELMEPLKQYGVEPIQLDLTDPAALELVKQYLADVLEEQKLDVLFNNAGQSCTFAVLDANDKVTSQAFEINVLAPMRLTREFSQFLINAKGTILFVGSLSGLIPFPFSSVYCATKAAIHQYAHAIHLELKPLGVRVINVITGGVATNIEDKRPLPPNSLWNIPEGQKIFEDRRQMSKRNRPMDASVYAKKVVNDIVSKKDVIDIYRGRYATILGALSWILPSKLVELLLVFKFKLQPAFDAIRRKQEDSINLHLD